MTVQFITSGTTWTVPSDWNNANNSIECIGGGGNGDQGIICICFGNTGGAGGGGGAYSKVVNQTYTPSATRTVAVGGVAGDTSVKKDDNSTTAVLAKGGASASGSTAGQGGQAASGIGSTTFSGGNGGATDIAAGGAGGGGGGAAGPNGAGSNGGAGVILTGGAGGNADNNTVSGPAGQTGSTAGLNGNSGTEFDGTHGCGTGGSSGGPTATNAGDGALYGGAGAGNIVAGHTGVGKQGLIVITYTPAGAKPFVYYDFSSHPSQNFKPETPFNNIRLLLAPAAVQAPFSYYEFPHPPTPVIRPDILFPNLQASSFSTPVGSISLFDAPPVVRGHPEWQAPNLPLFEITEVEIPFVYYEFLHPPAPPKGPETIFPNLQFSTFNIPVGARILFDGPPIIRGHADFVSPNLALFEITETEIPFSYYEFPHPPSQIKGPEFVAPNLVLSAPNPLFYYDFSVHPAFTKTLEFTFPNIALEEVAELEIPFTYTEYLHPTTQVKGPDFQFPNLLETTLRIPFDPFVEPYYRRKRKKRKDAIDLEIERRQKLRSDLELAVYGAPAEYHWLNPFTVKPTINVAPLTKAIMEAMMKRQQQEELNQEKTEEEDLEIILKDEI